MLVLVEAVCVYPFQPTGCITAPKLSMVGTTFNWPTAPWCGLASEANIPADLFGPVANIKDWELLSPGSTI